MQDSSEQEISEEWQMKKKLESLLWKVDFTLFLQNLRFTSAFRFVFVFVSDLEK